MSRRLLIVDGNSYVPLGDIEELKNDIVDAAHAGGGFVVIGTRASVVEIFVSSAVSVRIEEIAEEEEPDPQSAEERHPGLGGDGLSGLDDWDR